VSTPNGGAPEGAGGGGRLVSASLTNVAWAPARREHTPADSPEAGEAARDGTVYIYMYMYKTKRLTKPAVPMLTPFRFCGNPEQLGSMQGSASGRKGICRMCSDYPLAFCLFFIAGKKTVLPVALQVHTYMYQSLSGAGWRTPVSW
jgi:hypothetical protein